MKKTNIHRTLASAAVLLLAAAAGVLASGASETGKAGEVKELVFGVAPGPYRDLITFAIKPGLEKKGYTVKLVQFQDYVQPNPALTNRETTANLFQPPGSRPAMRSPWPRTRPTWRALCAFYRR